MIQTSCRLLGDLILEQVYLKVSDRPVIDSIVAKYPISDEPGLINDYLREQTESEAETVYLTGKYAAILMRLESNMEELEADISIDLGDKTDAGFKRTRQDLKHNLFCNQEYAVLRGKVKEFRILNSLLEKLSIIVFRRQGKLEQLSINYRRETEADKRHNFE